MTKKNATHICLILDRSGSMMSIREDVAGGVNAFLKEQREAPGECTFTLAQFDDQNPFEVLYDHVPIKDAQDLGEAYRPRGNTPLFDAVGKGIVLAGEKLAALPEHERPERVVFVTMTDGLENASREYNAAKVSEMTKHQKERYGWQFMYLGANQNAQEVATSAGIVRTAAVTYDTKKIAAAMKISSNKVAQYRASGQSVAMNFSDEDRRALS
jgi:hypothetical protein